jgi:hypothetical protein
VEKGGSVMTPKQRQLVQSLLIIGGILTSVIILIYMFFSISDVQWNKILLERFAVVVGLPMAALLAVFIVLVFKFSEGPIEFEGIGFKFKGASGQVILWVMCFVAIAVSIKLLWNP